MKTIVQKIHLELFESFSCKHYETPYFETNWHKHDEHELILITAGNGNALIGDYIGEYTVGDIFFIASNLPHWFRKHNSKAFGSAMVIHFNQSLFGDTFLQLPENKQILQQLQKEDAIQLKGKLSKEVEVAIKQLNQLKPFNKLILLLQTLMKIASSNNYLKLTQNFKTPTTQVNPAIEKIIDFSFNHYLEPVTLQQVATLADMSIPTFCRFFKKNLKKTYFEFLQDLRIGHACKLLTNTQKPILQICYESGYNSWAHFSKQFKELKQMTPKKYRNQFE